MNEEALLGPLPDSFKAIYRLCDSMTVGPYRLEYVHKTTKEFQVEDPQSGPLPPGVGNEDPFRGPRLGTFVNNETGEETHLDTRLTSEELQKRGVPFQVFELV
jgi:hypothetical protein